MPVMGTLVAAAEPTFRGDPQKICTSESVHNQLFSLPDTTLVYPAHDYKGRTQSTIGDEKTSNPIPRVQEALRRAFY